MHLQTLSSLYFTLAALVTSPFTRTECYDSRTATIQRFPLNDTSEETIYSLSTAMHKFKKSHSEKIEATFLGIVSTRNPPLAEQIFVWHSDRTIKTDKPFLGFSSTKAINVSATATFSNRTSLYGALRGPITETIIQDLLPTFDRKLSTAASAYLREILRFVNPAWGAVSGYDFADGKSRRVAINGWEAEKYIDEWLAGMDDTTKLVFDITGKDLASPTDLVLKHLVEIQ